VIQLIQLNKLTKRQGFSTKNSTHLINLNVDDLIICHFLPLKAEISVPIDSIPRALSSTIVMPYRIKGDNRIE